MQSFCNQKIFLIDSLSIITKRKFLIYAFQNIFRIYLLLFKRKINLFLGLNNIIFFI
jgi:hypothetical protein